MQERGCLLPFIVILLVTVILSSGCERFQKEQASSPSVDFFAMNTFVSFSSDQATGSDFREIQTLVADIEKIFSANLKESELYALNHSKSMSVSTECAHILERATKIAEQTDGCFNPCLGNITTLWDVTGNKYVPSDKEIAAAFAYTAFDGYTVSDSVVTKKNKETLLDLGAAIKGYTAERVMALCKEKGITSAMINIGGNVGVLGNAPKKTDGWQIGIRNPFYPDTLAGYVNCKDTVISVSGAYERYFEKDGIRYHHIFDGATGMPAESGLAGTVVIAKDGLVADALSTALFVMGKEKALAFYNDSEFEFEAILFSSDGNVTVTDGLQEKFMLFQGAKFADNQPLVLET